MNTSVPAASLTALAALAEAERLCARSGARTRRRALRASIARYRRGRDLPGLIALPENAIRDGSPAGRQAIIRQLKAHLRAERRIARAPHPERPWSAARYRRLLQALAGELAAAR